jgi:hypothetical protein
MNDTTNSTNDIIIDLTQDFSPDTIKVEQLVHQQSFERLAESIKTALPGASGNPNAHNKVFFIDGTRGAGKSTFLAAVSKALPEKLKAGNGPTLCSLPVIDPTMMETGEMHVIFPILAAIKKLVECNRKGCESWDTKNDNYENWRKQLQKLARGANLLNGTKQNTGPLDDFLSLDEGMANASSGAQLCGLLHQFLKTSAEMLGIQGFIIAFDDVDTDFAKGWQVLELIRRYLQCPHIVVLITGDLQLYTHLVRQQQFKNLGDDLHKHDKGREKEREEMVDHLEQQYLMKLFPLQNRVHLNSLAKILNSHSLKIKFGNDQIVNFETYTKKMVRDGFLVQYQKNYYPYWLFILNLPMRAVLQILRSYHGRTTKEEPKNALSAPQKLADALLAALMGSLYKVGVDVGALKQGDQGKLIEAVFDTVVNDGDFSTGIYLQPQSSDEAIKNAKTTLAVAVAARCYQRPDHALQYMLSALGSLFFMQEQNTNQYPLNKESIYVQQFKKEMAIGQQNSYLSWVKFPIANLLCTKAPPQTNVLGILKIFPVNEKADKTELDFREFAMHPVQRYSLLVARHEINNTKFLSAFNLIGAITDILTEKFRKKDHTEHEWTAFLNNLTKSFITNTASWVKNTYPTTNSRYSIEAYPLGHALNEKNSANIEQTFSKWIEDVHTHVKNMTPSALLIGKIWNNLHSVLTKITHTNKNLRTGDMFNGNVLGILSAFLIAEMEYIYHNSKNRIITVLLGDFEYEDTLHLLKEFSVSGDNKNPFSIENLWEMLPLTTVLFTCPLIFPFLLTEEFLAKKENTEFPLWLEKINGNGADLVRKFASGLTYLNEYSQPEERDGSIG